MKINHPVQIKINQKELFLQFYVTTTIQKLIFSVPKETRLSPICRWKNVFIRVLHLFKNWDKGRYTLPLTLKGHKDQVKAIDCNSKYI